MRKESLEESNLAEEALPEEFDVSTIQKTKIKKGMSSTMSVNRNIDHLMDQMEETDLDDGVKVNYGKFGDLLADVKAITGSAPEVN